MFEDSTFESSGRIHTRSRGWMIAAGAFNGSILLALVLIPLIYPAALPSMALAFFMEAPPAPTPPPRPIPRVQHATVDQSQMRGNQIIVPTVFPHIPYVPESREMATNLNVATMDFDGNRPGDNIPFGPSSQRPAVREQVAGPVRVPGLVVQGLLIHKVMPEYPAVPCAAGIQGTVVLQATISRTGTIENLRVESGPIMLRQAAINAVQLWRYRPYLLNGDPVEVETTVNVIFKMQ
jgi:protein TonB